MAAGRASPQASTPQVSLWPCRLQESVSAPSTQMPADVETTETTWVRPQGRLLLTAGAGKGPQSLPRANRTHPAGPAGKGGSQAGSLPWKDSGGDQHKGGRQDGGPRSLGGARHPC